MLTSNSNHPEILCTPPPRILVVDDLVDLVRVIEFVLENAGYQVESATSGKEALAKMDAFTPNLVLLDVSLPDITGFEVLEEIRKRPQFANLPVVLMTGYAEADFATEESAGATEFFQKPIDTEDFLKQVKALIKQYCEHSDSNPLL